MNIYEILNVPKNSDRKIMEERYQKLIDTYTVILDFSNNEKVRQLAKMKLEKLKIAGETLGFSDSMQFDLEIIDEQVELGKIKVILSSYKEDNIFSERENIHNRINKLSESAEKHYLLAILKLQVDRTLNGFDSAITELSAALKYDPENVVYRQLLSSIAKEIENYQQYQQDLIHEQDLARKRLEDQSRRQLQDNQFRSVTRGITNNFGDCVLGGVGCFCFLTCCIGGIGNCCN